MSGPTCPNVQSIRRCSKKCRPSRGIFAVAALVPGMTTNIPDVGGSETHQLTRLSVHGSEDRDVSFNSDGLDITGNNGNGGIGVTYYNQAMQEEVSVQSKALPAEIGGGGIYLNMVSKDGGNQFRGAMFTSYTNESLQSNNVTDDQRALGMTDPARVDSLLDFNPTFGGPLIKDRLWFMGSYRYWRNNRFEANTYNPGQHSGARSPAAGQLLRQDQRAASTTPTGSAS